MMAALLGACTPDKKTITEASVEPPAEEEETGFAVDSPLYFQVGTRWEMDEGGAYEVAKTNDQCHISSTDTIGAVKYCVVTIPEAKLYYSNLKFVVGSNNASKCEIVTFSPYYYRRSNSDKFLPAGQDSATDCSPTSEKGDDRICYGGAAPTLFSDFPKTRGRYFNTSLLRQFSYKLPSENSTKWYGGESVNYLVANNITNPNSTETGNGPGARTGAWQDYEVACRDQWEEPLYQIHITIQDENFGGASGSDHFQDWP